MISTKNIIGGIRDVNEVWLFEHLLSLNERLEGQEIVLRSPLTNERTPSFTLFQDKGRYFYKCFSSGNGGSATQLAQLLFPDKPKGELYAELCSKYKAYLSGKPEEEREFKQFFKYKLASQELRNWNSGDKNYWSKYSVGSKELEHYNIAPLTSYVLSKEQADGTHKSITIEQPLIYGFFTKQGAPFKLYQPHSKTCKYFKVKSYIGGADQLTGKDTLVLVAGMKDGVCLMQLGIEGIEFIFPDSENVLIDAATMKRYQEKYKRVVVLFDSDSAGVEATKKYEQKYKTESVYLSMSGGKDIADFVAKHRVEKVRTELIRLLK